MKTNSDVLKDNFRHVTDMANTDIVKQYREEGVHIDAEGLEICDFGTNKEFEWRLEPFGEDEDEFLTAIYHRGIRITEKLHIWLKRNH